MLKNKMILLRNTLGHQSSSFKIHEIITKDQMV